MTTTDTRLYGTATAQAWDRLHPRLTRRAAWADHEGPLPIIAGTVIRLQVDHLPSGGEPKPVWLWWSTVDATRGDVDRCWQMFLRRFDIEHTFRLFEQTLGWTAPKLRDPRRPTAGPGSSSPPNSASPVTSLSTCADHGKSLFQQTGSPRPESAEGSGTSVRRPLPDECAETLPSGSRTAARLEKPLSRHAP
jgi:hypothetical protein